MKSLLFVFAVMVVVVLVVGCNARRDPKEFDTNKGTTVVTPADETEESSPLSVTAADSSKSDRLVVAGLENNHLETAKAYQVIRGMAPQGTDKVKVNDYTLQRYRPGQKTWTYLAATRFSTLKKGDNTYTVLALDRTGNEIDRTSFTIAYNPVVVPQLPNSGNSLVLSLALTGLLGFGFYSIKKLRV